MPSWLQWIIGAAALVTAAGVLWAKVLKPGARLIVSMEEAVPILRDLTCELKDTPNSFKILKEIIAQFRTDSGSSLRDVVNRLDTAATDNRVAAEVLAVNVEAVKQLAVQDRSDVTSVARKADDDRAELKRAVGELAARIDRLVKNGIQDKAGESETGHG